MFMSHFARLERQASLAAALCSKSLQPTAVSMRCCVTCLSPEATLSKSATMMDSPPVLMRPSLWPLTLIVSPAKCLQLLPMPTALPRWIFLQSGQSLFLALQFFQFIWLIIVCFFFGMWWLDVFCVWKCRFSQATFNIGKQNLYILIIIIVMIIILIVFLKRLSMSNMLNYAEQVQVQNIKHMHIRRPKQHVSKQSCSNIQLSSKDGFKKQTKFDVPITILFCGSLVQLPLFMNTLLYYKSCHVLSTDVQCPDTLHYNTVYSLVLDSFSSTI